ncbi:MAG: hypothetical protein V2A65_11150 [Candidatus Omnitrophota bacterium]
MQRRPFYPDMKSKETSERNLSGGFSLSPLQKFIVRNWGLIARNKIAAYFGVEEDLIRKIYQSLNLPETTPLSPEKAFPIIVRVNWDILSEKEIRRLLGMSEQKFRKKMQTMDMLDLKLGRQPEGLERIYFKKEELWCKSTEKFKVVSTKYLADYKIWEKPFGFLDELSQKEPPRNSNLANQNTSPFNICMMYSYTASHGDFLLTDEDFYPEGILSRLQNRGVNAGWMPVLLRDLAPSKIFTEFGSNHTDRIRNLRKQVQKALRYGINLYLYLNEPRYITESFFKRYPGAKGMAAFQEGYYGMCTSETQVRDWIFESVGFIFSRIPELGGIILITASELETNCYSHIPTYDFHAEGLAMNDGGFFGLKDGDTMCPRCQKRGPEAVLSDLAHIVSDAIKSTPSKATIIQWLWSWNYIMPISKVKKAIRNLPPEVEIMVDWQRGTRFKLFGREAIIDEYTLAYTKPSGYAVEIMDTCKELKRKVIAKCAVVSTVEMNALPYLPVLENVEKLIKQLRKYGVEGLLGCWIFGAYPGRNMEMLGLVCDNNPALHLAQKYYGKGASYALSAWKAFSKGMKYFPTVQSVLYYSALNSGPGLKFRLKPEPWRSGMVLIPTEKVEKISGPLEVKVLIKSFRKTAEYFSSGLNYLKKTLIKSGDNHRKENIKDYGICKAGLLHLLSVANYSEFIVLRDRLIEQPDDSTKNSLIRVLKDEEKNIRIMLELMKKDSRIGYEGSVGYFYTPIEIMEKMVDLKQTLKQIGCVVPTNRKER